MENIKKDFGLYYKHFKGSFISLFIVILINMMMGFGYFLFFKGDLSFNSTFGVYIGCLVGTAVGFGFSGVSGLLPLFISLGRTRKGYNKSMTIFVFLFIITNSFILTMLSYLMDYKDHFYTLVVWDNIVVFLVMVGLIMCIYGFCLITGVSFYMGGIFYGFGTIFFILSILFLFWRKIYNAMEFSMGLEVVGLGAFILGIVCIIISSKLIEKLEIK